LNSAKDSAQSPPMSKKPWPTDAFASFACKSRT
jgi:hypothetical protein